MKRIATLTLAVSLLAPNLLAATIDGAWTASIDEKRPDRMYFSITRGRSHQSGNTMRIASFANLTEAQIKATTMTPVRFEMRREAGTAVFEGTFRNGKGAGQFDFTPNRAYIAAVEALGVKFDLDRKHRRDRDRSEDEDLFALALHDVSTTFIKTMINEGYKVPLEEYLSMRIFDVTPEYIREMRALGFKDITSDELVSSRIHGVTPDYVREMRAAGWNVPLDDLQSSRIHGATPEFAAEMKKLGYGKLSLDELVSFRIHGVSAQFINELRTLGYANVDADDLVSMRIHRVTPEFIRELEAAGYTKVPVEKMISMRIHGVDAKFIKTMSKK
ncbi:MAG TPA: hypothetical protein VF787_07975 [Thermoanaerobaculia bacterium]